MSAGTRRTPENKGRSAFGEVDFSVSRPQESLSPVRHGHKAQRERKDALAETQRLHSRKRRGCTSGSATVSVAGSAKAAVAGSAKVALRGAQRIEVGECNAGLSQVQRMHSHDALRPPALRHQAAPLLGACVRLESARLATVTFLQVGVLPENGGRLPHFLPPSQAALGAVLKKWVNSRMAMEVDLLYMV